MNQGQEVVMSAVPFEEKKKQLLLEELDRILESRFFRNSGRSKQFLQYIVHHRLEHCEPPKERLIGAELFGRRPDYATGDDSIVRVQAIEVRRRLEQYYQAATVEPPIHIKIPLGSYSPVFSEIQVQPKVAQVPAGPSKPGPQNLSNTRTPTRRIAVAVAALLLICAIVTWSYRHRPAAKTGTVIDEFWAPIFTTPQPVLVCLAKATVYRPTEALFQRYSSTHSGAFRAVVEKYNRPLAFNSNEKISWGDMREDPTFGVARGDTYAALTLSSLFGSLGKPDQVRIGSDYSFSDLKNSPSVIVGAFNNRWTLQIASSLHFGFVEENGKTMIREQGAGGRMWEERYRNNNKFDPIEDAAIVARLLDSGTGQFTIVVAGVGESGTQAASELVTQRHLLEQAVRELPSGWQKKNLEIVLRTTVTDSVPGPPQVVATYSW